MEITNTAGKDLLFKACMLDISDRMCTESTHQTLAPQPLALLSIPQHHQHARTGSPTLETQLSSASIPHPGHGHLLGGSLPALFLPALSAAPRRAMRNTDLHSKNKLWLSPSVPLFPTPHPCLPLQYAPLCPPSSRALFSSVPSTCCFTSSWQETSVLQVSAEPIFRGGPGPVRHQHVTAFSLHILP
jgi:hypothetical protein